MPTSDQLYEVLKSVAYLSGIFLCLFFMIRFVSNRIPNINTKIIKHRAPLSLDKLSKRRPSNGRSIVAILPVRGVILDQETTTPGPVTFAEQFRRELNALQEMPSVGAVIVELSTPGGTVVGSANIASAIAACTLPVFVYVEEMAASGGVWALTGAKRDHVFAHPESLIGSIGVLGPTILKYDTLQASGGLLGGTIARQITGTVLSVGGGKSFGNPFASEDDREFGADTFTDLLERTYERFLAVVCKARGTDIDTLRTLGAAVVRAPMAKALGLVHDVLTQQELERHIKAYLGSESVSFVRVTSERGKLSDLFSVLTNQRLGITAAPDSMKSVLQVYPELVFFDHNGILGRL